MLHVEIVLKTNNRKRKRVLCMTYSSGLSNKRARAERATKKKTRKENEIKHVKHVKCKDVLLFICGPMKQG